jgi:predicted ATP-dependent protease
VAVTGDVDLRGHMLEVGGLQAKLSACHAREITTFVLPEVSLAWLRAAEKGTWPAGLKRYCQGEGVSLLGVKHVVDLLVAALEGTRRQHTYMHEHIFERSNSSISIV